MYNRFSTALVCGFGAAVLMTVPGLKDLACCLIIPIAALISLRLDQRLRGPHLIPKSKGAVLGLMTGVFSVLFAGVFDLILTYLTHSNDLVIALPEVEKMLKENGLGAVAIDAMKPLGKMAEDIRANGFSPLYAAYYFAGNFFINGIFGTIGGLIGASIINNKNNSQKKDISND